MKLFENDVILKKKNPHSLPFLFYFLGPTLSFFDFLSMPPMVSFTLTVHLVGGMEKWEDRKLWKDGKVRG